MKSKKLKISKPNANLIPLKYRKSKNKIQNF